MTNEEIIIQQDATVSPFTILTTRPERIREAVAANLGSGSVSATDFERIKLPAGGGLAFTINTLDGEESVKDLTGIVVDWRDRRAFWKLAMEQSESNAAPDCYSPNASLGIGSPGGECSKCEFAQFGSDPNGGQACKISRELYLVREKRILPEIVSLPPTSIKPVRQYLMRLAAEVIPFYAVITEVTLEKTRNVQGITFSRAKFASVGRLTPEQTAWIKEYAEMLRPLLESALLPTRVAELQPGAGEVI